MTSKKGRSQDPSAYMDAHLLQRSWTDAFSLSATQNQIATSNPFGNNTAGIFGSDGVGSPAQPFMVALTGVCSSIAPLSDLDGVGVSYLDRFGDVCIKSSTLVPHLIEWIRRNY